MKQNVKTPGMLSSSKQQVDYNELLIYKQISSLGDIFISMPYVKTYCDENSTKVLYV